MSRIDRMAEVMSECAYLRETVEKEHRTRARSVELIAQALATAASDHRGQAEVDKLASMLVLIVRRHAAGAELPERE